MELSYFHEQNANKQIEEKKIKNYFPFDIIYLIFLYFFLLIHCLNSSLLIVEYFCDFQFSYIRIYFKLYQYDHANRVS